MPSLFAFPLARALAASFRHLPTYLRTQGLLVLAAALPPILASILVLREVKGSFAAVFAEGASGVFRLGFSGTESFAVILAFLLGCVSVGVGMLVTESLLAGERLTLRQAFRAFRRHAGVFLLFCVLLLAAYLFLSFLPILAFLAFTDVYGAVADPPQGGVTYVDMSGWRAVLLTLMCLTALAPLVRAAGTALLEGGWLRSLRAGFQGPFSRQAGLGLSVALLLVAVDRLSGLAFVAFSAPVIENFGSASAVLGTGFPLLLCGWVVKTLLWLGAALLAGALLHLGAEERPALDAA